MKFIDLIVLGHKHISAHKRQSVLTVLTIGLLFGAILGIIFLFEGLENLFIRSSDLISGDKIYVTAASCSNGGTCLEWSDIEALASKKAGNYGGALAGKLSYYEYKNGGKTFYVIDEKFVDKLLEIDLGEYQSGTLFKLISLDEADRLANGGGEVYSAAQKTYSASEISELKQKVLGQEFKETYSVPTAPEPSAELSSSLESEPSAADLTAEADTSTSAEEAEPEYETKELTYVVAGVIGTSRTSMSLAKKYSEVRLLDFFLGRVGRNVIRSGLYVSLGGSTNYDAIFETAKAENSAAVVADYSLPIIEFNNFSDAYDFYRTENCALARNADKCSSFVVDELVGNRLQTRDTLDTLYIVLRYIGTVLLLIAVTIAVFTFMRLISENVQSIALYRSLGASTLDLFAIYFFYFFELCLITLLFAIVLGFGVAAVVSLKNAADLATVFMSIYAREIVPGILFGVGPEIMLTFAAILGTAPLCSILTVDQLSHKNIAKRIRQN